MPLGKAVGSNQFSQVIGCAEAGQSEGAGAIASKIAGFVFTGASWSAIMGQHTQ